MPASPRATHIHIEKNGDVLIKWSDGIESRYSSLDLRDACRCAGCRDERTGKKTLERAAIRPDIYPDQVEPVGNYVVAFTWNDGHREGIYTWELLRGLSEKCPESEPV